MNKEAIIPWYTIHDVDQIDSPALILYHDRLQENIVVLISMIDNIHRLRPHVKTHKIKEVALMMMEAGIQKFKCATIAEAEMMAMIQAPDVLLAYQPIGPKAYRLVSLVQKYPRTRFSCLVDENMAAQSLSEVAHLAGQVISVYIDLNVGMNRTGILPGEQAVQLYDWCARLPGIQPIGLHAYDGHITNTDFETRETQCNASFAPVQILSEMLINKGFEDPIMVVGGSASFPIHLKREKVECSPGTFIYWDAGYQHLLPEQTFQPAALVMSRIISLPDKKTICTDLGHKSVAAENSLDKRVVFINAPELKLISQSEEHLTVEAGENHPYQVGGVLYGLPFHICPTSALYEKAFVIKNKKIISEWKVIGRDRKLFI